MYVLHGRFVWVLIGSTPSNKAITVKSQCIKIRPKSMQNPRYPNPNLFCPACNRDVLKLSSVNRFNFIYN